MRNFPAAIDTEHATDNREACLVKFDFPSGAIATTTAGFAISHGGDTYQPDSLIQTWPRLRDRADGKVQAFQFGLSLDSTLISRLADKYKFQRVTIYAATLDADHATVETAQLYYQAYMSHHEITRTGVTLFCLSDRVPWRRKYGVLTSDVDQKTRRSGDDTMKNTDKIVGIELNWGGLTTRVSGNPGNDGGSWGVGGGPGVPGGTTLGDLEAAGRNNLRDSPV